MVSNDASYTHDCEGARSEESSSVALSEVSIVFVQKLFPAFKDDSQGYHSAKTDEEVLLHV